ncbi:hypothetical protein CROQUDRAFT_42587 [Cronartium quercuum f. sp. fusiforme G11]|uniref:Uncharacterized protein n=1 Tax=Cronartium quercuum f. sp. fusiforme G11 TaxID=708437 RepID=A0A9P6NK94_9BASI|nr:hypothetical protein CROQUDRAFT_42587 [Cronartium quercuum f. sp. fusiforme G11]
MRDTRIKSLSHQLMSQLVGLGNLSRDVQKTCSEKLSWSGDFWREYLKKQHDRILIIRPPTQLIRNNITGQEINHNHNKKSILKNWPINLEIDALELCILESGGDSPICVIDWTEIGKPEKFTTVFVHRLCLDELCNNSISPLWQMTMSERPRVQVFGAVMIPTMKSLLEKVKDSEKLTYYRRLQIAQQSNPILRVFISRFDMPNSKVLKNLPIDEAIELLMKFDLGNDENVSSLQTFVLSKQSGLEVLKETYGHYENEDEEGEIKEIVGALLAIRKACWKHFRRYIIVVDSHSPLLKSHDREILCGLEIMSIQLACELAEKGPL